MDVGLSSDINRGPVDPDLDDCDYLQSLLEPAPDDVLGMYPISTRVNNVRNQAGGDYTLASDSAARNAGADASGTSSPGMDIGAHQSADAGGGGSRVIITG